ncbi:uncharacterized protein LOC112194430 [Rosa chinensis]|uniref:uncharacterized protein LOC112194430 n=1 Tax=Rosa chinensis TaxID=74649 RepID=UPI000D08E35D|nr:uncharacterized protein LOC112194430 [Rosa chinensis]
MKTLGVQDVMGTLKAFDQRLRSHDEQSEKAFQTLSLSSNQKNDEPSSSNSEKGKQKMKKNLKNKGKKWEGKPKCTYFNRFGHVKKDCNYKGNQQANCIEEQCDTNMFSVSHAAATQVSENVWLVDSACSNHMATNANLLYDIDYNNITKVKMGNGMLVDTKGK